MNDFITALQTPGTNINAILVYAMLAWELAWKGLALWKAANRKETYWFAAILVINSVGLLPILYLFIFSDRKERGHKKHLRDGDVNTETGESPVHDEPKN